MAGRSPQAELQRARRLEDIRVRGVRGGVISPHRSMVGLPWTSWRLGSTIALSLGGLALFLVSLPWVGRLWQYMFERIRDLTGLDLLIGTEPFGIFGVYTFNLPSIAVVTPLPDARILWTTAIASAAAVVLSFMLPARFTPLRYFIRLLALLLGSSILFFAVSSEPFPYRLADHVYVLMTAGLVVMGLVPLVLGLTLHVFDLDLWKKALLTVAILVHLAVFVPLQVMVHVWLVLSGTAVLMPVLFLVFGLLLDVLIFVSFYGWALSWKGEMESREAPPPAHLARTGGRR